jgi:hypothetical protein
LMSALPPNGAHLPAAAEAARGIHLSIGSE